LLIGVDLLVHVMFCFERSGVPFSPFCSFPSSGGGADVVDVLVENAKTFVFAAFVIVALVARLPYARPSITVTTSSFNARPPNVFGAPPVQLAGI
jgi:hypothetical protein